MPSFTLQLAENPGERAKIPYSKRRHAPPPRISQPNLLPLFEGSGTVGDGDFVDGNSLQCRVAAELRLEFESVCLKRQGSHHIRGKKFVTRVGVRQLRFEEHVDEEGDGFVSPEKPLVEIRILLEEARAEDSMSRMRDGMCEEQRNFPGVILEIRVLDDRVRPRCTREAETNRRSLSSILLCEHDVAWSDVRVQARKRLVPGSVVHEDELRVRTEVVKGIADSRDSPLFIEEGNDDRESGHAE